MRIFVLLLSVPMLLMASEIDNKRLKLELELLTNRIDSPVEIKEDSVKMNAPKRRQINGDKLDQNIIDLDKKFFQ